MPVVGTPASYTYLNITRNKLIELAHKVIGVLEPGQVLSGEQLEEGVDFLTMIVQETDRSGKWLWTFEDAAHIPIVSANCYMYSLDNGLPTSIAELISASFRTSDGRDTPLKILRPEDYEKIENKILAGEPKAVYLTESLDLSLRNLHVWPSPNSVTSQSEVVDYRCILSHTSNALSEPGVGPNWKMFWTQGGSSSTNWALNTSYTAPASLRLLYRRPIADFVSSNSNPDFPRQWPRILLFKLAFDLGDIYGIPLDERNLMIQKAKGAFNDIFVSTKTKTNNIHNKAKYF